MKFKVWRDLWRDDDSTFSASATTRFSEFRQLNFQSSEYLDGQGKPRLCIEMTKDGFVFLAMGFTGRKAAAFKEAYIVRFNEMEAELRAGEDT